MGRKTARSTGEAAADATRSRLLEAAGEIFAEVGYQRATIREICARAGVNVALINYHFGDKLELYGEVLSRLLSASRMEADPAPPGVAPEKMMRDLIRASLRVVFSREPTGWLFRILAHEIEQPTREMARIIDGVSRPLYNQLCEIVGAMLGLPADHEETRMGAHSVMGQVILYILVGPILERLWPELNMTWGQPDRIADHITDFSLAYLRQHTRRRP
jgi:AcrR family transcriptional regulator